MKVILLGTGSPIPSPDNAGPATLLRSSSANLLFDAGRGVVMRLAQAQLIPPMLSAVLLTHLHSDHVCDLNDIITTHWVMNPVSTPLIVVGPVGTRKFVEDTLAALATDIGYRIGHHADLNEVPIIDVREVLPGQTFELAGHTITAGATDHRPVEPTLAYRVSEGEHSVVIAGDGVPCTTLDELLSGATVYVQTVIRPDFVKMIPNPRFQDILDYHSSVEQAAATAERAGVKVLLMTHFVPPLTAESEPEWRAMASTFSGKVVLGPDLTEVDTANL